VNGNAASRVEGEGQIDTATSEERVPFAPRAAEGELRSRVERGDEEAYADLSRRFGPAIQRFAMARLGGDSELAEEVMVQTLAAAVRSARSFDPRRSSLSTWIHGTARRVIQGELRTRQRRKSVPTSVQVPMEMGVELAAEGDLAASSASRLEARRKVALLADELSDAEMEALLLHFVEEFSLKEIAQIVGRSPRAVHSLLHRAKQKARERLEKHDE